MTYGRELDILCPQADRTAICALRKNFRGATERIFITTVEPLPFKFRKLQVLQSAALLNCHEWLPEGLHLLREFGRESKANVIVGLGRTDEDFDTKEPFS